MEIAVLGPRWVAHGPVNATYNLGKCGIESVHHYMQDKYYNSYNRLRASGIPFQALLRRMNIFQNLNVNEQVAVESFLLSRRDPASDWRNPNVPAAAGVPDAATAAGMPAGSNARNVLDVAHGAYAALTDEQRAKVDAFLVGPNHVAAAAFVHGSQAYNNLNALGRLTVDRYQPGSKEYEDLRKHNIEAWKIVRGRIKTQEAIRDATRSLMISTSQFCKNAPVPVLGGLIGSWIKERVGPRYPDFDPDRREKYIEVKSGTAAALKIEWEIEQITQGALDRFQELQDGTRPDPVTGAEGPYRNLGEFLANQTIAQEVRRMLLNKEADMGNITFQMQHSIQKMYTACHDFKKNLHEHMMDIIKTGKNEQTIYKESLNTFLGKMMSEAWECEPIIMGGRHASGSVF